VRPGHEVRDFFALESFVDHLVDPIGAGDALLAYASLALATTGSIVVASILGSIAAAVACQRNGNLPVSQQEMAEKIDALERRASYA
jgi:sugar/nucleoside kinase (ribokinase family)